MYKKGFTLIELLVVVSIISLISSVIISSLNSAREKANLASAKTFAKHLQKSLYDKSSGYWNFDECSGSSLSDSSGEGDNGTVSGTAQFSTDTPFGTGCSFLFNSATRIQTSATLNLAKYTKASWVKMTSCSGFNNIISASSGTGSAFGAPNCSLSSGHSGTWGHVYDPKNINDGKWHHVAVTYNQNVDGGTMVLYKDGKEVSRKTGVTPATDSSVEIGSFSGANYFGGYMDDVVIYFESMI